jgi:hypothetical protein
MKGLLLVSVSALAGCALAQHSFTGSYAQNFDSLASTGTNIAWTDGTTLPNWHMRRVNDPNLVLADQYDAGAGTSISGAVYSFGSAGSAERALGSIGSGSVEHAAYGLLMRNDSLFAYDQLTVTYWGEQWRNGNNLTAHSLAFSYDVTSAGSIGADLQAGGGAANYVADPAYTLVPTLNFTGPVATAVAGALDGNAAANKVLVSATFTFDHLLNPGDFIWIRWVDVNDAGNDHGLSVDDLELVGHAVPEPATLSILALGALGLRRRRK